jgi:hypothetical protein
MAELGGLITQEGLHVRHEHQDRFQALLDGNEYSFFEDGAFMTLKIALARVFAVPPPPGEFNVADDLKEAAKKFEHVDVWEEWALDAAEEVEEVDYFEEWEHAECWGEDAGPDVWDEWADDPIFLDV